MRRPLLACLLTALLGVPALPAAAEDVYPRDADSVFSIEGHGWGHGHGLSQWGAQGGASLGRTADEITSFYYPGTARATQANTAIRVLLQAGPTTSTTVWSATGLTATDTATGAKATLPSGPTRWRTVVDSAGLHLQSLTGSTWSAYALGGATTLKGPVDFAGPTFVRVATPTASRDYRGTVRSKQTTATALITVNVLPLESYLQGVVPREASSSWKPSALQAQATAARSYSTYKRSHAPAAQAYDICDTTQCQVYGGAATWSGDTRTSLEPQSTNDAIAATAGVIRTYEGAAIFAEFSSSNGGWSTDGGVPYLKAQQDDWDGAVQNTVHSWTASLTAAQVQARYPAVGTLQRIRVTQRDGNGEWGGRVKTVVLEGTDSSGAATSVTTTGAGIYNANSWPAHSDGLRSSWWRVAADTTSTVVSQSAAPTLVQSPGVSTGTLTVTLRNSGSTSWSTSGLHLAVSSPVGEADPLVGGSTTPGVYTGSATAIAPGEDAPFSFALTGDAVTVGVQGRAYRLRNGTGPLFGTTVSWQVPVVAPAFTATRVGGVTSTAAAPAEGPGPVLADGRSVVVPVAGETGLSVQVQNTGNVTWPGGDASPVALGTSAPLNRRSASAGPEWGGGGYRPARLSGDAIAPGSTATFGFTLHGNGLATGVTPEAFEPVWEREGWTTGAPTSLQVVRVDPATPRLAGTDLAPPSSLALTTAPSGTATLVVRLRNLGGQAWTVGTDRLRASSTTLATSAWKDSTTPPALAASVTRPGRDRVWPGEVGEWRVPLSAYKKAAGTTTLTLQAISPEGAVYGPVSSTKVTVTRATFTGTFVKASPAVRLPRTGRVNVSFDVKNTGTTSWDLRGPVRSLVTTSGGSPSKDSSWLSASRPGPVRSNVTRPGKATVAPGEVARFVITLAGNGRAPQSRTETFGVLWEGWARLGAVSATISYSVV